MQFCIIPRPARSTVSTRTHRRRLDGRFRALTLRVCGLLLVHVSVFGMPAHATESEHWQKKME